MKPLHLLLNCGGLAYGAHYHHVHSVLVGADGYAAGSFQSTAMPREAQRDSVLIVGPVDCPNNAARTRRAKALAVELDRRGIPNSSTTSVSFVGDPNKDPGMARLEAVMEAGPPIVFINGQSKADPSPDEVEEIFRRTRAGT